MKHFEKNWLEWAVFGVGMVLVLAVVGYLAYEAATSNGQPAAVEVLLGKAERRGAHFAVPVTVANRGDKSAEVVLIRVELVTPDGRSEHADLEIPLLPGRATREGWVTFSNDPAKGELRARALGFHAP